MILFIWAIPSYHLFKEMFMKISFQLCRPLLIISLVLTCFNLPGWSINPESEFQILPDSLDGSMMIYDFSAADTSLDLPDSLEVVHVAYVARHGARYLSSAKKVTKLTDILQEQKKEGTLTSKGAEFLLLLDSVNIVSKGRWGALSEVGIQEEVRLGEEMARLFPKLMQKGEVRAKATYVPRVVMTMYQFLHSLAKENRNLNVYTMEGPANDSLLRCFDTFKYYSEYRDSGDWKIVCDDFIKHHISPRPAQMIFGKTAKDADKARSLTMDIYAVLQGLRAMGLEGPTTRFMTEDEYRSCWEASNLERYLRNTFNPLTGGCTGATRMLINDIINDCDRWESPQSPGQPLTAWFGHAETLMPMLSMMGISGCSYYTEDWDSVSAHWRSQDIVPLGANFMLILLRPKDKPQGQLYAAIRLNGKNIFPFSKNIFPFQNASRILPWNVLKGMWKIRCYEISALSYPNVTTQVAPLKTIKNIINQLNY